MVAKVQLELKTDDFNLTNMNPCCSSFLVSSNPLSRTYHDRNHKLCNMGL